MHVYFRLNYFGSETPLPSALSLKSVFTDFTEL